MYMAEFEYESRWKFAPCLFAIILLVTFSRFLAFPSFQPAVRCGAVLYFSEGLSPLDIRF